MRSDRKQTIIFIIILLILSMGIGYAYLTTTLSIDGISDIDSASWDVHWANVQVKSGSVSGSQVTQAPTINAAGNTVSYHINLKKPGEFYEFTVDAVNAGTIDAMIESMSTTLNGGSVVGNLPNYIEINLTYADGIELYTHHLLSASTTETYKFTIRYKTDIEPNELPSTNDSLELITEIEYVQADSHAFLPREDLYGTNSNMVGLDSFYYPDSAEYVLYDNYQDAIDNFGANTFIKYRVINGIIKEMYIGFVHNNNVYYLKGGDSGASYEENVETLINAFGSENCGVKDSDTFKCEEAVRAYTQYPIEVSKNGNVRVTARIGEESLENASAVCAINNGYSICSLNRVQ